MTEQSVVKKMILEGVGVKRDDQKTVSYSQYTIFKECPFRWQLTYKEKLYPFTSNINSVFGTAVHETVQHWLDLLYNHSVKASEELNFEEYLSDRMLATYAKEMEDNGGAHFIPKQELKEYYADGINILHYLRRKRKKLFDYREEELVSIELPLIVPILEGNDRIVLNGFVDLLFYNKKDKLFRMPDIKTSTKGWSDYQKKDEQKMDQVRIYKHYISKHYNIPVNDIDAQYLVLKRKVYEDAEFPIPRHLTHTPPQGPAKMKLAVLGLEAFVKECFNADGSYQEKDYKKCPGRACKFCPFANTNNCNMIAD